jgi:hypothetical protein
MEIAMTETDWLTTESIYDLTHHKRSRSDRKRRLLACACSRRALTFLSEPLFAEVVTECERFADDEITWKAMLAVRKRFRKRHDELLLTKLNESQRWALASVQSVLEKEFMSYKMAIEDSSAAFAAVARPNWESARKAEEREQLRLARDVFLNPFRPVECDPSWRTSTVLALAETMYTTREFAGMPILADALEEAGCTLDAVLTHCRDADGLHTRACWVVDLVLDKA